MAARQPGFICDPPPFGGYALFGTVSPRACALGYGFVAPFGGCNVLAEDFIGLKWWPIPFWRRKLCGEVCV